jgi:hypothetical protein
MEPRAIRKDGMVRGTDGLLRVETVEAGREYVLDPLAELVWGLCDGSRTVDSLAHAASHACDRTVQREEVFSALDFLADAGLIEQRVAPPVAEANVSRRALLARIAPMVGAAAWIMSGLPAKAAGLMQESSSKEYSNKESDRKASDRESNNKESSRKSSDSESSNKENGNKSANRESSSKEDSNKSYHKEVDDKRDWDKQQDAEKARKRDTQKSWDRINESESKRAIRAESAQQKMKASWPWVYYVVGHKVSEFPDLLKLWVTARRLTVENRTLTRINYEKLFQDTEREFKFQILLSEPARTFFTKAGFAVALYDLQNPVPVLAGDSQKKSYLIFNRVADPLIGENWRYSLNADNLRLDFYDPEAAFQFLSTQQRKAANPWSTNK